MSRWKVTKKERDNIFWGPDELLWVAHPIDRPTQSRGFKTHSAAIAYAYQAASDLRPIYVYTESSQ